MVSAEVLSWSVATAISLAFVVTTTVLVRARRRDRRSIVRLERAVEALPVYLFEADVHGQIVNVSERSLSWLGVPSSQVLGDAWLDLVHPEDRPSVEATWSQAIETGNLFLHDHRFRHDSGEYQWFAVRAAPDRRADGTVRKWIGSAVNADRRHRLEQENAVLIQRLQHAQRLEAVGQLAGGVAHSFNNVLTAMLAAADLARGTAGRAELNQLHDAIRSAAERGAQVTRQILAFSRKQTAQREVFSANAVLEDLYLILARLLGEDIELTLELQPTPPLWFDRSQFDQVILNLAVNARDAMPKGGDLVIATHTDDNAVVLEIRDTGCGIPADLLGRIFDPFFTTKGRVHGTGLGLAAVKTIVEDAAGQVEVRSIEGTGTVFSVHLPAAPSSQVTAARNETNGTRHIDHPDGNGETILFCEDDESILELVSQQLSEAGYNVLPCANAHQAHSVFKQRNADVDLLLSDVVLPDRDGFSLLRQLRSPERNVASLLISGYSSDVLSSHDLEGTDVLTKPFTRETLLRRVRDAIDKAFV